MSKLKGLLKACNISNIYWIDDEFCASKNDTEEFDFVSSMEELALEKDRFDSFLEKLKKRSESPLIEALVQLLSESKFDEALEIDSSLLGVSEGIIEEFFNSVEELKPESFKVILHELEQLEGIEFKKFSFSEWRSFLSGNKLPNDLLLLVDLENDEPDIPEPNAGLSILSEVYSDSVIPYFILLTHRFSPENEHSETINIKTTYLESKMEVPFSVLTKSHFQKDADTIKTELASKLTKILFLYAFSNSVNVYRDSIKASIDELSQRLLNESPDDLYKYWFRSSFDEGSSEEALIKRLLLSPSIRLEQKNIAMLLKLREISSYFTHTENYSVSSDTIFHEIRKSEIWYDGEMLNSQFSPLEPGDVFEDSNSKKYILVAGPCDIALRNDGKRKKNVGYLVPIVHRVISKSDIKKLRDQGVANNKEQKSYVKDLLPNNNRLIFLEEHDSYYYADLSNAFLCHLDILEWCSFNSCGSLVLSDDLMKNKHFLLHGWQLKLEDDLNRFKNCTANPLMLNKSLKVEVLGDKKNSEILVSCDRNSLSLPFKRTTRLQAPFIEVLQTKYHQYLSRKAFEHDFVAVD